MLPNKSGSLEVLTFLNYVSYHHINVTHKVFIKNVLYEIFHYYVSLDTQPTSGVSALVKLFYQQEELARTEERKTDAILDGEQKPQATSQEEVYEETVAMCKLSLLIRNFLILVNFYFLTLLYYTITYYKGMLPNYKLLFYFLGRSCTKACQLQRLVAIPTCMLSDFSKIDF